MENLQDDFYQLENKQVKGAKLRANIRWEPGGEKCSKSFINCINSFLINYFLSFQIFKTPGERLASWVLPLKQESYLSYLETNIKTAFTNIQPKVKIDGPLSDPFTLMRGVQQECPSSILLYITIAEVLPNSLIRIKGIQIGDHEIKIVATSFSITWIQVIRIQVI